MFYEPVHCTSMYTEYYRNKTYRRACSDIYFQLLRCSGHLAWRCWFGCILVQIFLEVHRNASDEYMPPLQLLDPKLHNLCQRYLHILLMHFYLSWSSFGQIRTTLSALYHPVRKTANLSDKKVVEFFVAPQVKALAPRACLFQELRW